MPLGDHDAGDELALGLEPLLGPRQGALVDAATFRLAAGHHYTDSDLAVLGWLTKVLGMTLEDLEPTPAPAPAPDPAPSAWRPDE